MAETALNFGPDWLRALSHGSSSTSQPSCVNLSAMPKYSLAQYRYGREEMLALIPKDPEKPECLKRDTSKVVRDAFMLPLALTPATEDEQRLWARSVNSDAVLRASGKSVSGNNLGRSGRGGSADRGRGRGRGSYYQRGVAYEDSEDGPPSNFSRPKIIERSQSANEKDQRWDERDRRYDRTFSGRGNAVEENHSKPDSSRNPNEYWRKFDKDEDSDWRRPCDKSASRGSWRSVVDKDRRDVLDRNPSTRNISSNSRNLHSFQKNSDSGEHLPEWSVDDSDKQDVGTFDSTGAFLETKVSENSVDEIYVSDDADEGLSKDHPEAKRENSKKMPKKSSSVTQMNSLKQTVSKQTDRPVKDDESHRDKYKNPPNLSAPPLTKPPNAVADKSADHVINPSVVEQQTVHKKQPDFTPMPNVPNIGKSVKNEHLAMNHMNSSEPCVPSAATEEDAFAHHKKATENMVAQWTEEEEQRVISQTSSPVQEKDNKWFYQDPQGEIQGPFTSPEMLEWFSAGYFTTCLMVRRTCDEKFSQLGELIKSWGRVPFLPGSSPPPVRANPLPSVLSAPITQTAVPIPVTTSVSSQLPKQDDQLLVLQQQLLQQQLMQQQLLLKQAQLQQILTQLKQQENFTSLNLQQQQVLIQQLMTQQQIPRPNVGAVSEQPGLLETMTPLPLPLLGLPMTPLLKNNLSLWNMTASTNPWPLNVNSTQTATNNTWDVDPKPSSEESDLEKQKRLAEEIEKLRKAEEQRLELERELEEKKKLEELKRKQEEERLLQEQKKQEEEKERIEEKRRKEEEKKRKEELKQMEELKRKEEELRIQEELKKQEELRKLEEQKKLEEKKRLEEQKRLEEIKRKEEEQLEFLRLEEQRKLEEKRKKEELQKKLEREREREREKQLELERQKEALRQKELEEKLQRERERQRQKEKEDMVMKQLAELKLKSQGPAWGIQNNQPEIQLSLADIQRLQEEKEKEDKEERLRQQIVQQQAIKQVQQNKNGLSWAKRSAESQPAVKSLAEIQQEEAERLAQQQRSQKPIAPPPAVHSVGVWGNTSQLNKITSSAGWNTSNVSSGGFWDDALNSTQIKKQTPKTNDSAFPALSNPEKPATTNVQSNKSKNVRAKKDEDAVMKLFTSRTPTDEFTTWCTETISAMPSPVVDIPTFVAFLKDVESPYEVTDYIKSYLGCSKEAKEFSKQFLERRIKFRAKQTITEENTLWGPAPAITPGVNKPTVHPSNDTDGNTSNKEKKKKKKNRMQKLDNSMLGFTVQSNPDRLNVGEIDHVEGM